MKAILPILVLGVAFASTGAVAEPMRHNSNIILSAPLVATPVLMPTVNSGALGVLPQQTIGAPVGNLGAISPVTPNSIDMQQNFGALPGEPGSATYDPNAALPSLGNEGSSIAPTPGTSDAGFNQPSVSSGTGIDTGTGG